MPEQVPKQVGEPKVFFEVKQPLFEETALNVHTMRFYGMPFPLSRPNSPSFLLATVSTPYSDLNTWSQHLFKLLSYAI